MEEEAVQPRTRRRCAAGAAASAGGGRRFYRAEQASVSGGHLFTFLPSLEGTWSGHQVVPAAARGRQVTSSFEVSFEGSRWRVQTSTADGGGCARVRQATLEPNGHGRCLAAAEGALREAVYEERCGDLFATLTERCSRTGGLVQVEVWALQTVASEGEPWLTRTRTDYRGGDVVGLTVSRERRVPPAPEDATPPGLLGPLAAFTLPEGAAPRCALVWLHGLDDSEEAWAHVLRKSFAVDPALGPCRFLLPRAPVRHCRCAGRRTTCWFDMSNLPVSAGCGIPLCGCSLVQALESLGRVRAAIDCAVEAGVPPERVMVGGFSQGGALALLAALTDHRPLAGAILLSGVLFFAERLPELAAPGRLGALQVFWGHGSNDNVLDISLQAEGVNALREAGVAVTDKVYPVGHASTAEELGDAARFFAAALAERAGAPAEGAG